MIWVSLLMVLLFVSATVILDGWLGRMRNSHPHCRQCSYDLVGSWESARRCPECGADLASDDSVKWGHFDRNWPRFWLGLLVFGMAVTGLLIALARTF